MEGRKLKEVKFHDKIRDESLETDEKEYCHLPSNRKFYLIARKNARFVENYLLSKYQDKKVLDYCCGDGNLAISLAKKGLIWLA